MDIWGPSNFQSFPSVFADLQTFVESVASWRGNDSFGPKAGPVHSSSPSQAQTWVQQHKKTSKISRNMEKNKHVSLIL